MAGVAFESGVRYVWEGNAQRRKHTPHPHLKLECQSHRLRAGFRVCVGNPSFVHAQVELVRPLVEMVQNQDSYAIELDMRSLLPEIPDPNAKPEVLRVDPASRHLTLYTIIAV